jgi:hypothetical protein
MVTPEKSRFREFDFTHPAFTDSNPAMQELLKRAYKSKMSCSEFIEEVPKNKPFTRGKQKNRNSYTNAHKISERYQKLDSKFNFFGNYD